jgi:hypothetical protein
MDSIISHEELARLIDHSPIVEEVVFVIPNNKQQLTHIKYEHAKTLINESAHQCSQKSVLTKRPGSISFEIMNHSLIINHLAQLCSELNFTLVYRKGDRFTRVFMMTRLRDSTEMQLKSPTTPRVFTPQPASPICSPTFSSYDRLVGKQSEPNLEKTTPRTPVNAAALINIL